MASDSDTYSTATSILTPDSDTYSTSTSTISDPQESSEPKYDSNVKVKDGLVTLAQYSMHSDDHRLYMAMIDSCRSGNRNMVERLLKNCVELERRNEYLRQALMISIRKQKIKIVELLLKHGADSIVYDYYDDCTPLLYSCKRSYNEIVGLLIRYGVGDCSRDQDLKTALIISCEQRNLEIVEALLQKSNDNIDVFDRYCMSALMYACKNRDLDNVRLLLQHGANVNSCNDYDETALIYICQLYNADKVAELLLENGADVNHSTNKGMTALISACECHASRCKRLIEVLLKYGADVNARDYEGKTALIHIISDSFEIGGIVELFLQHNVDIDAIDLDGKTALMHACINGYDSVVNLLLQHNVKYDLQCEEGSSAIMLATFCEPDETDDVKCLEKLLAVGANLDFFDRFGCTVFSNALQGNGDCLKVLLNSGKLLDRKGFLRSVHKNANNADSSLKAILMTIDYRVFEWEWCRADEAKIVAFAALNAGFCPGKMVFDSDDGVTYASPLILAFIEKDEEAARTYLNCLYFFPDDYKILISPHDPIRLRIANSTLLEEVTHQPMTLAKWSFLYVSKAISLSGHHTQRPQRVDSLPIPEILKKKLKFKVD